MTLDPVGYDAGDPQLYRYEGNDPLNRVDPSGLADEPPFPTTPGELSDPIDNCTCNPIQLGGRFLLGNSDCATRAEWIKTANLHDKQFEKELIGKAFVRESKPDVVPTEWKTIAVGPGTNIAGGTHKFFCLPDQEKPKLIGTRGASPCVGLLLVSPDSGKGAVFHFYSSDEVNDTLGKYVWRGKDTRYKTYVFGGSDEALSRAVLGDVLGFCKANIIEKGDKVNIVDSEGLLVGPGGKVFLPPPLSK